MRKILGSGWLMACALISTLHAAPPRQWTTQKGAGFSVETPQGWTAFADAKNGWVHLMGTQGEDVVIWPVFLPGGPATLDLQTAQFIHEKLAASGPYQADWGAVQPVGANTVRAVGKSGNMVAVSAFAWKSTPRGVTGYFYLAGARETEFAKKSADLARVLDSFRLVGIETTGLGGGIKYVPFSDPMEGAFTTEVPAGWQASGGTVRSSPDDPHIALGVTSPDGLTKVSLGDAQMGTSFMEPMPGMLPEGSMNGSMMMLRYLTGAYFCQFYVSRRAPMFCSEVQITDMRDNPEMVQYVLSRDPTLAQRPFTIGSLTFQCREQGQLKTGFCQAMTTRLLMPMGGQAGMWHVSALMTYLAPPDRTEQAKAIMTHMNESIHINPRWRMNEIQNAGVRSGIISGTGNWLAETAAAGQHSRDAVDDRIARMRSDATLGVVRVEDPVTGRRTTVDSGANYYWVDPAGRVVGTQVDTLPGVEFRRVIELPIR
jgi:hypothetical protein